MPEATSEAATWSSQSMGEGVHHMSNTEEVLVVGAGPVGLVAACQLARLGVHVRVIDALRQRTTQSRAVGIQARSLEMLASLGVLPRLELRGRRMRALEVVD